MKNGIKIASFIAIISYLLSGCGMGSPPSLTITKIVIEETQSNEFIDLPSGTYVPDNPDFDVNNPETWTGNMAQYAHCYYMYTVSYSIKNVGGSTGYDSEIDLYYMFDDDSEKIETVYVGNIRSGQYKTHSISVSSVDKQLVECDGVVFWFD